VALGARIEDQITPGDRRGKRLESAPSGGRHRQFIGRQAEDRLRGWKQVGDSARGTLQELPGSLHDPRGERPGAADRDLLAQHRAHRQFVPVDVADQPPPRGAANERPDQRVGAQPRDDRLRIGIEVEQRA